MGRGKNVVSREEVEDILAEPTRWRVDWCEGSGRQSTDGYGTVLPHGVLQRVPTRSKQRKFERGARSTKTWFQAFVTEVDGERTLRFVEGPA